MIFVSTDTVYKGTKSNTPVIIVEPPLSYQNQLLT